MAKYIHKCKMCKNEFENDYKDAKFCSKKCYYAYRKQNGKLRDVICPICKTPFRQKYAKQIFCSVECRVKSTENKLQCICEYCGKPFFRQKSEVEKNTHHYCSNSCRINAVHWCMEDIEVLKENFGKIKYKDMSNLFSKYRNPDEIKRKAISLGLTTSRKWTNEEIKILVDNYPNKPMSDVVELLPCRTVSSIIGQARQQNLKSFFYLNHIYTQDEEDYLRNNYLTKSNDELGENLGRTAIAIAQRLLMLDLHRPTEISNYGTIYEYIRQRIIPWRNKIREDCNYTCELTGVRSNIVVHHIRGFNLLLDEAIYNLNFPTYNDISLYTQEQLDNLLDTFLLIQDKYHSYICISEKVHKHFHSIYGYGNNTEEQWNEFVSTYYK